MMPVDWFLRHKIATVVICLAVSVVLWWVLVAYINPQDATHRKDLVQVFALIVAGIIGLIGAVVGLSNLRIAQRNLEHNREALEQNLRVAQRTLEYNQKALRQQLNHQSDLEQRRAQDAALQSYFEQIGELLADHDLISNEDRVDLRQLARGQTLTVLASMDGPRKRLLVRFLYGAGLINRDNPIVVLTGANLRDADFTGFVITDAFLCAADFSHASLSSAAFANTYFMDANLSGANLSGALLGESNFTGANLSGANLIGADLSDAYFVEAKVNDEQLAYCKSLKGATMPDGKKYEAWRKTRPKFKVKKAPSSD
jgi:uncharacterized protein YjbI with pentapeptide repeats